MKFVDDGVRNSARARSDEERSDKMLRVFRLLSEERRIAKRQNCTSSSSFATRFATGSSQLRSSPFVDR